MSEFITFRFPADTDPKKMDGEITSWGKDHEKTQVDRTAFTSFLMDGKNYLILSVKFEDAEKQVSDEELEDLLDEEEPMTYEELEAMFDACCSV